jgi:glycosyltransferase involved in cell wall biosynthesis/SAM-dependent methyltransferase
MDNAASKPTVAPSLKKHYTPPVLRELEGEEKEAKAKRLAATMKIHVLGVPHTITRKEFSTCAFTQKVLKLCAMMHRRGHHVIHYGVEGSDVECTEHVSIATEAEWSKWHKPPGTDQYVDGQNEEYLSTIYAPRLNAALRKRTGPDLTEILAMTWGGTGQRSGIFGINQWEIETGIGYRHPWADFRVFESYAWLHMHLGANNLFNEPKWYWAVIPNSFDVDDFSFKQTPSDDFLYLGRLNEDKGVRQAINAAKEAGRKITIVGQGDPTSFLEGNPHVTYLPPVGPEARRRLLANACAVFCPSHYVEPFCGVHVEAMMSGTPVITTDWGVFSETVFHGVTGYRCRTIEQFTWAAKNVHKLKRRAIVDYACRNFSLERVALMYEEYFQQVLNVRIPPGLGLLSGDVGLYMPNPDRQQLDWLSRETPVVQPYIVHNIPHIPPPLPPARPVGWALDQQWERDWWGLEWAPHWDEEIEKQKAYFRLIGFPDDGDFGAKTVLDVGCGPVSQLTRTNHGFSRGVDPLAVSDETLERYRDFGIEFLNIKAEEMPVDRTFDEVWMYNCLQHVDDPNEILRRMLACAHTGTTFRIFEWIDLGVCPGHPQNLTETMFWNVFGGDGFRRPIWNVGALRDFGGTATNKYLALVAVKQ